MRIHHIFHSGFLVITRHSALLFDWYTGDLPQRDRFSQQQERKQCYEYRL